MTNCDWNDLAERFEAKLNRTEAHRDELIEQVERLTEERDGWRIAANDFAATAEKFRTAAREWTVIAIDPDGSITIKRK